MLTSPAEVVISGPYFFAHWSKGRVFLSLFSFGILAILSSVICSKLAGI
jgi:hypothetical protein